MHLYYNMISFLVKGRSLERRYGSANFAFLLFVITVLTNVIYVVLGQIFTEVLHDTYYMKSCAIGFSGK
jgi:rhomboid domain-containing protein 1